MFARGYIGDETFFFSLFSFFFLFNFYVGWVADNLDELATGLMGYVFC